MGTSSSVEIKVEHVDGVDNDAIIAQALQEELSNVAFAEASGPTSAADNQQHSAVLTQQWLRPRAVHVEPGMRYAPSIHIPKQHPSILWLYYYCQVLHTPPLASQEAGTREEPFSTCSSPGDDNNVQDSQQCLIELMDNFSVIDGEVGKRLNNMVPVPVSTTITSHFASSCLSMQPTFTAICILKHHCECFYSLFILLLQHVPKTNGEIPSVDEAISDHQRLLDR
jgi:hypothetical protein